MYGSSEAEVWPGCCELINVLASFPSVMLFAGNATYFIVGIRVAHRDPSSDQDPVGPGTVQTHSERLPASKISHSKQTLVGTGNISTHRGMDLPKVARQVSG